MKLHSFPRGNHVSGGFTILTGRTESLRVDLYLPLNVNTTVTIDLPAYRGCIYTFEGEHHPWQRYAMELVLTALTGIR